MIESTPIMHVNLVIVFEMCNKRRDVTRDRTLWSSIWAVVRTVSTVLLMLKLTVVGKNILTAQILVFAGDFQRLSYLFQCQAPNVSKFMTTGRATVANSDLAVWAQCVAIWALKFKSQSRKSETKQKQKSISHLHVMKIQEKRDVPSLQYKFNIKKRTSELATIKSPKQPSNEDYIKN